MWIDCRSDLGDSAGQGIDEELLPVLKGGSDAPDLPAQSGALLLLPLQQGQRVNLDEIIDDELHAGQANAVCWKPPPFQGRRRIRQV